MAQKKISELPSAGALTISSDLLPIVNTGSTKKITVQELLGYVPEVWTDLQQLSSNWQDTSTVVQANSASWALDTSIDTEMRDLSSKWEDSSTVVQANSASWNTAFSSAGADIAVRSLTGNWESTYNTFANVSSTFLTSETDSQTLSFDEGTKDLTISSGNTVSLSALVDGSGIDTEVRALTSDYSSTYTTVWSKSADWDAAFGSAGADVALRALSSVWQDTSTVVQANSAKWILEDFIVACSDEATNLTTTVSAVTFRVPFAMYLNSVRASVTVAPSGSPVIVDVKQTGTSIFSTTLSIDENEETSTTAAIPAVISNPNLTDDAKIVVSVNQVGSSTSGRGLKLTFKGYRV